MLHSVTKEKLCFWFTGFLVILLSISCKRESIINSEEEEIYMADYESPADKWGYMDTAGRIVIKPVFDDVGIFSQGLACVNVKGRWGFIDRTGDFIIKPNFRSAWAFHEGIARVSPFGGQDFYITPAGKTIASEEWAAADDFSEGYAKVKVGSRYGFIDTSGALVLKSIYTRCWSFKHGLAVVSQDEKLGLINVQREEILSQQFSKIKIIPEANLILCHNGSSSFIYDLQGNEKFRIPEAKVIDTDGDMVTIQKGESIFFLDMADQSILPGKGWSDVFYLGDHRWAAKNENGLFLLDDAGTKISLKPYSQLNRYVDGIAAYSNGEHWGYMDTEGKELSPDVFGLAWDFKEGFARAAFSEGIAFINRKIELAFYPPPGTLDLRDFSESLAPIQIANQ
jgi:hypothetical protein